MEKKTNDKELEELNRIMMVHHNRHGHDETFESLRKLIESKRNKRDK
jgi:Tfp pilus assembly protein PilN